MNGTCPIGQSARTYALGEAMHEQDAEVDLLPNAQVSPLR